MDDDKKNLKGSPSRDQFKMLHKQKAPGGFYACDLDFILVAKFPARIVAVIDYKKGQEKITFSEVIAYNELVKHFPLFIIQGKDTEDGPFIIEQYIKGDWKPNPCIVEVQTIRQCESWEDLVEWENKLRSKQCLI